ncbi:hypothetical protein NP233_g9738 [Leucocoprinus birnbaumii]|uniref:Protein kinase domain-containing protein n=1 Tax=Leucocoprinus birnbaumii TaxID=56174 RepID=A0AAD5VM70_9AGAR|nr:hypothetical protein NP233_g9738 [Leucocoprinus birnbaumii]
MQTVPLQKIKLEIKASDFVIGSHNSLMGSNGSGKADFINALAKKSGARTEDDLEMDQSHIQTICFPKYRNGHNLALVKFPGFQFAPGTMPVDVEAFRKIKDFLYQTNIKFNGILFMHHLPGRISEVTKQNFQISRALTVNTNLGAEPLFTLVGTQWTTHPRTRKDESFMMEHQPWKGQYSVYERFDGAPNTAHAIVARIYDETSGKKHSLGIQKEIMKLGQDLNKTAAGQLFLQSAKADQKKLAVMLKGPSHTARLFTLFSTKKTTEKADLGFVVITPASAPRGSLETPELTVRHGPSLLPIFVSVAQDEEKRMSVVDGLRGSDAQDIIDYLDMIVTAEVSLGSDRKDLVLLLGQLTSHSGLVPARLRLLDDQAPQNHPVAEGTASSFYRRTYEGRSVCVKIVRDYSQGKGKAFIVRRLLWEAILRSLLSCPNIEPLLGVFLYDDGNVGLVSPWTECGDLSQHLKANPDADRIRLILDVASGLQYLHQHNVIHGDLMASNVLVLDNHAVITDFKCAKIMLDSGILGVDEPGEGLVGSLHWMAPELLLVDPYSSTKPSDIWSFGGVCYEVLTGNIPFYQCKSTIQLLITLARQEVPSRCDSEVELDLTVWDQIVLECFSYSPEKRPTVESIVEFFTAHFRLKDSLPEPAPQTRTFNTAHASPDEHRVSEIIHRIQNNVAGYTPVTETTIKKLLRMSDSVVKRVKGRPEEAQVIVDFLDMALDKADILLTADGKRILNLLCGLISSAWVVPRRYHLIGVQYTKKNRWSEGNSAKVYLGEYRNEKVCVKVLKRLQDNESLLKRTFIRELILWGHLKHPNVQPFYGVYLVDKGTPEDEDSEPRIHFVSPWMKEGNLKQFVRNNPDVACEPLIYDDNVLVSNDKRALITDFGISHLASINPAAATQGLTNSMVGFTSNWAAPELVIGVNPVGGSDVYATKESIRPTKASDIWSFGCLIYEVLSGRNPYHLYPDIAKLSIALHQRRLPDRPQEKDRCKLINDWWWDLMTQRCWHYDSSLRSSSKVLRDVIRDQVPESRERAEHKLNTPAAAYGPMDYERVDNILSLIDSSTSTCRI